MMIGLCRLEIMDNFVAKMKIYTILPIFPLLGHFSPDIERVVQKIISYTSEII